VADSKLVLHPVDPAAILQDPEALLLSLRGLGLVGASFSHIGELHYRAGARFAELVLFGNTSAALRATSCHVSLLETTNQPVFLGASNAQAPGCPNCQAALPDWKKQLLEWQAAQAAGQRYAWSCKCGRRAPVQDLVWGDTGGVARYSLDIWNVAPAEAVPSKELLAHLETEVFTRWRHFYYRF
jgi:hypothetical protein